MRYVILNFASFRKIRSPIRSPFLFLIVQTNKITMPKLGFHIDKSKEDNAGLVPIKAKISTKPKDVTRRIEKVKIRYWNPKKQRVIPNRENEPYNWHLEINELLDDYEGRARAFFNELRKNGTKLNTELANNFFEGEILGDQKKNFWEAYDEFMKSNVDRVSTNTTRTRKTAKNFIERFQSHTKINISFQSLTLQFFENLYYYALNTENLENNTFATYLSRFKSFLVWSKDKGYYDGEEHRKFTFTEKDKPVICLDLDELKQLYSFQFDSKRLDKARDLFCFGCFTGLRFSDITSLRKEHVHKDSISKRINKTKQYDRIPIIPQGMEILKKYDGESVYALPRLSNVKLNKYIKECCEIAGIKTPTVTYKFLGNKTVETVLPKHKLITAHTARKTFITLGFVLGVDTKIIKACTGHKKDSTFDKYLKIADDMKREKLLEAWKDF